MAFKPDVLYKNLTTDLNEQIGNNLETLYGQGVYPVGLSLHEYASLALSNSILKKFSEGAEAEADERALQKFLAANLRCKEWRYNPVTSADEVLFGSFKSAIWDFFNPTSRGSDTPWRSYCLELDPISVAREGGVGPGASVGARGNDFYTKLFDSPMSCTDLSLYRVYRHTIRSHPLWEQAENARLSRWSEPVVCSGNRLCFVPKTTKVSRVICVEPTLNMFFQMGAKMAIERRLVKKYGINLSVQPTNNRALARLGSLNGEFVTIDLESASDSMALSMLEAVLPSTIFRDLSKYRSPLTTLPNGTVVDLGLFSSMGNAFTFPLQTTIFASIVCSVYRLLNIPVDKPSADWHGNFSVFGDDIICRREAAPYVVRLLELLGFTVNQSKSFFEGPFRESCGADYYHGYDVRGVYLKDTTLSGLLSCLNLLTEFSAKTGVAVPRTCRYLRSCLRGKLLPVPRWDNDEAGWKVPVSFFSPRVDRNGTYVYKAWSPIPCELRVQEDKIKVPKGTRKRSFIPSGLWISFLKQAVLSDTIVIRQSHVRYRTKLSWAPNWCYASHMPSETTRPPLWAVRAKWKRWETAFYRNL